MSVKDNRVDVRYHRNTGKAMFIVPKYHRSEGIKRHYGATSPLGIGRKSKYFFNMAVFNVSFKAKYRMEC